MKEDIDSIRSSEIKITNNKDFKCAPAINLDNHSCIQLNILIELVKAYNQSNPTDSIKLFQNFETLNPNKYKRYLLKQIKSKLTQCNSQQCWTEQDFIKNMKEKTREELLKYTFRPEGPEGKFEWLNTINIDDVMKQYEKKYNNFKFLGAVPIDFDNLSVLGIKNLDFNNLINQGKIYIGIIFNLDKHDESGSHWVSLFSDLQKGRIYFYDSYGVQPAEQIRSFIRRILKFLQNNSINDAISDYNKIRHQYENSECGVYSINFILAMLGGKTFEEISNNKIPDKEINKLRNTFFINS